MKNSLYVLLLLALLGVGAVGYKYVKKNGVPYTPPPTITTLPSQQTTSPGTSFSSQTNAGGEITLTIASPVNNATVTTPVVKVSGKTVANADISVNDTELKADASGNFSTTVTLDEGENTIGIIVNDANGNSSEQDITVTYTPNQ